MRVIRWLLGATLLFAACPDPGTIGGLRVEVRLASNARSACVKVFAVGGGVQAESGPFAIAAGGSAIIAVGQGSLPSSVTLEAQGFSDSKCTTRLSETSGLVAAEFPTRGVSAVVLLVSSPDALTDGGTRDGGAADSGQPDAGAGDAGSGSLCVTCGGSACNGQACGVADSPLLASCDNGVCRERNCGNNVDDNVGQGTDCADPDCAQKSCGLGTCVASMCTSEINCSDGIDNDSNGKSDCADPSCDTHACNDALSCSVNEVCGGGTCGSGVQLVCPAPVTVCFAAGVCAEPGGCSYAVATGASCDDGTLCTINDSCGADAGCQGIAKPCNTPPPGQCWQASGTCSESDGGACAYDARSGSCDDGQNCTAADQCHADGTCTGTAVTCTPGECQAFSGTCAVDGACIFSPTPGASCGNNTGRCTALGACQTLFPYSPSNFSTADVAQTDGGRIVNVTCPVVVRANSLDAGGFQFVSGLGCVTGISAISIIKQGATNTEAMLFTLDAFTVQPGGSVHFEGNLPVIMAVLGNVSIAGAIDVSATATGPGAGGRLRCGAQTAGDAVGGGPNYSGGGGAGYGGAGEAGGFGALDAGLPGDGGLANGSSALTVLRGGCPGGDGQGLNTVGEGQGAYAAGAIQISAAGTLSVAGRVSASGGGGNGGSVNGGGGGGSSGGGVLLEGNLVTMGMTAALTANGGSGGCGGATSIGANGVSGSATTSIPASTVCAPAGFGGIAGFGGSAGNVPTAGGNARAADKGGGGGGGAAVGRIRVNSVNPCTYSGTAVRSPVASSATTQCR